MVSKEEHIYQKQGQGICPDLWSMHTQCSLGNDQYPKSVTAAQKVLSKHQYGKNVRKSVSKAWSSDMEAVEQQEVDVEVPALSFAQLESK